jgi:uncharacterized protein (DUF4415 family)
MPTLTVEEVAQDFVLDVSEADYRKQLAETGNEDAVLRPGRHKFRGVAPERVAKLSEIAPSNRKVKITMYLDADVLEHFKSRAAGPQAAPYQTQINAELRAVMEREQAAQPADAYRILLEDEQFLAALAAKLQAFKPKRRRKAA